MLISLTENDIMLTIAQNSFIVSHTVHKQKTWCIDLIISGISCLSKLRLGSARKNGNVFEKPYNIIPMVTNSISSLTRIS